MSGTEQQYYEMLVRTDHPVFQKDYSATQNFNSPLNSIWNRIIAKQLVRVRAVLDEFQLNLVPDTVTLMTINDWETEYFGFTKPSLSLAVRISELLIKVNRRFGMTVQDATLLGQAITGVTPVITRNVALKGWVMGRGVLGLSTTLATPGLATAQGFYLVSVPSSIDSNLLTKLDQALTNIEKAGSSHKIQAPTQFWVLGRTALGINTTLGLGA